MKVTGSRTLTSKTIEARIRLAAAAPSSPTASPTPVSAIPCRTTLHRTLDRSEPSELESCHTARIGGYTVEGHIPAKVVDKLLAERPQIDGIAMPGMPDGSPGMPGLKRDTWTIFALKRGSYSVYTRI